jgi:hypothetical protein
MRQMTSSPGFSRRLVRDGILICLCQLAFVLSSSCGLAQDAAESAADAAPPEPGPNESVVGGVVLDVDEHPVPESTVTLHVVPEPIVVRTDKAGRFRAIAPTKHCVGMKLTAAHEQRLAFTELLWEKPAAEDLKKVSLVLKPQRTIEVQVGDAEGQPVEQAKVGAVGNYAVVASGTTNAEGKVSLRFPIDAELHSIFALHREFGLDYRSWQAPRRGAKEADTPSASVKSVSLRFSETRTVRVQARDLAGKPIPHMRVFPWYFQKPDQPNILNLYDGDFCVETDDQGVAIFRWIPLWNRQGTIFWPLNEEFEHRRAFFEPGKLDDPDERDSTIVLTLGRKVAISGTAKFGDGKPGAGLLIRIRGDAFHSDPFHDEVTTDENGQYELLVPPNQIYSLAIDDADWASVMQSGIVVRPNTPVADVDFDLQRAVRVTGRMIDRTTKKPIAGQRFRLHQVAKSESVSSADLGVEAEENRRRISAPDIYRYATSDDDGRFEFRVGPGDYSAYGPSQVNMQKFHVEPGSEVVSLEFTTPRPEVGELRGFVITGSPPKPVPGAIITGISKNPRNNFGEFRETASEKGHFRGQRSMHNMVLHAKSKDGSLAGAVEITADDMRAVIKLKPTVTMTGRLIDKAGNPIAGERVSTGRRIHMGGPNAPWRTQFGAKAVTDQDGRFEFKGLVSGEKYHVNVAVSATSSRALVSLVLNEEFVDLGDLSK